MNCQFLFELILDFSYLFCACMLLERQGLNIKFINPFQTWSITILSCKSINTTSKICEKLKHESVPEEAAIIDNSSAIDAGRAVADLSSSNSEARDTICRWQVFPALNHGEDWCCTPCLLCSCKIFTAVQLCSKIQQCSIEVICEFRNIVNLVLTATCT